MECAQSWDAVAVRVASFPWSEYRRKCSKLDFSPSKDYKGKDFNVFRLLYRMYKAEMEGSVSPKRGVLVRMARFVLPPARLEGHPARAIEPGRWPDGARRR